MAFKLDFLEVAFQTSKQVQKLDFDEMLGKIVGCPWIGYTWLCCCFWTQTAGQCVPSPITQGLTLLF